MLFLAPLLACAPDPVELALVDPPDDGDAFVLLELFTSQSCSACPVADENVNELARLYRDTDVRVFTAAFHTTRWDGLLGWTDVFSDPRHTERHRAYMEAFDSRVYTPQMVTQGEWGFNGRSVVNINHAMDVWLNKTPRVAVSLTLAPTDGAVQATVALSEVPDDADLQLLLLEGGIEVAVSAGENGGETLQHENVVRGWITVPVEEGRASVPLPSELDPTQAWILALVQRRDTLKVLGADQQPLL